jgi:hypothetical protein
MRIQRDSNHRPGTLAANPFPYSDRELYAGFSALAGGALSRPLSVVTPFAGRSSLVASNRKCSRSVESAH